MVEEGRYCIDILTQISAATTALESLAFRILDDHVKHCVANALASGDEAEAAIKSQELIEAVHPFSRTSGAPRIGNEACARRPHSPRFSRSR